MVKPVLFLCNDPLQILRLGKIEKRDSLFFDITGNAQSISFAYFSG